MTTSPTFIDLFCGAGGLSLGLQNAGWTGLAGFDIWNDAVETYNRNIVGHQAHVLDLTDEVARDEIAQLHPAPDWVVGGPPCQGFSTVGKRQRTDPRNRLVWAFADVVTLLEPTGFVIENVIGLRDMRFVDEVQRLFTKLGYRVAPHVVTAADYGVPQLRRRILFIGHRHTRIERPPAPTHRPSAHVTVSDAIGDLPPLAPGETATDYTAPASTDYQRAMRQGSDSIQGHTASRHPAHLVEAISHIPDGGNRSAIPDHLQPKSGFHNSYSRLHSASPAVAVTQNMGKPSGTRCIHPFQNRGLTAREGARLQSFPDRYHFASGITSQRLQIANAVPPRLGEAIGRHLGYTTLESNDVLSPETRRARA